MSATGSSIFEALVDGNRRYCSGIAAHPRTASGDRERLVEGQSPRAIVVGCSDSRVPPEIIFDAGLGDLFVIRVVGNVVGQDALGSIEFAVDQLECPLLIVLGHSGCGAVSAVVEGAPSSENLNPIVEAIRPSVDATEGLPGKWVDNAAREHARRTAAGLAEQSLILSSSMEAGRLTLLSAYYDLETGRVESLDHTA